ncbi:MAG: hypothetical protein K2Q32_06990 [Alphaproteobacteria bacterium]|nr:hypothetical protein [Alphaproteobacteria bacterium]
MHSGLARLNQPLEQRFRSFLTRIVQNDELHGRFLNTLSLLEHIGSRKIMLSHVQRVPNTEVLKHMAEEARHAFFFAHKAEALLKKPHQDYSDETTLAPAAAKVYFAKLDSHIEHTITAPNKNDACYLWVSLMIELRAHWAYGMYQAVLSQHQKTLSLKSLIAEENLHLAEMFDSVMALDSSAETTIPKLAAHEHELFLHFFAQLEAAV